MVSANTRFVTVRFVLSVFFHVFVTCTGFTGGPVSMIYKSYDVLSSQGYALQPFVGFVDMASHLHGRHDVTGATLHCFSYQLFMP